jgi:periplasmic protein CpxP/Spy
MMKKTVGLICALLCMVGFTACNKTPKQKAEYVVKKITSKLDLTEVQVTKLNVIKDKVLKMKEDNKQSREETKEKVKGLILQEKIDEGQVRDLISQKRNKLDELLPQVLPEVLDFHASLKKEQKEELIALIEKFRKKHH